MSTATQPATPKDIQNYEPTMLTPDKAAALANKLDEWLKELTPEQTLPKKVFLTRESAKAVHEVLAQFLDKINTYVSLKEASLVRHP